MFDKKEDQLFDYAFGELNAHEAQIFEASLLNDEVARSEAELLRSLKSDLVSFRDIPEMQFSKERLRSAILEQGLKPKKPGIQWVNWLLAPTAVACVMALGLVLMNGTSRKDPELVLGSKSSASKPTPFNPILAKPSDTRVAAVNKNDKVIPNVQITRAPSEANRPTHSINRTHSGHSSGSETGYRELVQAKASSSSEVYHSVTDKAVPSGVAGNAVKDTMMLAARMGSGASEGNTLTSFGSRPFGGGGLGKGGVLPEADYSNDAFKVAFANVSMKSGEEAKLIVIDSDQDSGVGAAVATEVNNTTNVVIGG